jgi:two-component system, LytTR family, response regulator
MKNLTTILIDDEPHCMSSVEYLLEKHFPTIKILAKCTNGEEAVATLQKTKPNFIFLDIEMPLLNGFQVLEKLDDIPFSVIFTTAYSRYAVRAFRFCALDFLLKPVDQNEFIEAVNRVIESSETKNHSGEQIDLFKKHQSGTHEQLPMIALPTLEGLHFVNADHIQYCESDGNYTKIYIDGARPLMISRPLKDLEEILEGRSFFRIHKQFVISLRYIRRYKRGDGGEVEMTNLVALPVARNRKEAFLQVFGR